jgi:glycosyltransferase involved in cell wall biosynthesis
MTRHPDFTTKLKVGVISTRLAGTDGVSLETEKWISVMQEVGIEPYYFAGELDRPADHSYLVPEAHFSHPSIMALNKACFETTRRTRETTKTIHQIKDALKEHLYIFVEKHEINWLLVENALTIPMNIPLGLALTEFIAETNIRTAAHHHDFYWERDRFAVNAVSDYLNMSFPPDLPSIRHFVINSFADEQLSFRTGISSTIIPNIMDFENPPSRPDAYADDVRRDLGVADDELFVLQPTRIVRRKGIEHAIELVKRLERKAKLVISHSAGDEGFEYENRIREYSGLMGVDTIFAADRIDETRGTGADGKKIYTLEDVYPSADLVTYPSLFEGFGNAFLEALYFRKPVVVNTYSIYTKDIKPRGFDVIELDGYVTDAAVEATREVLDNAERRQNMVDLNYSLGREHFSYDTLRRELSAALIRNRLVPGYSLQSLSDPG